MGCLVVKLGSSLVADERGNVRADVLGRICDELSELHHDGRAVVVVTSGAIARGNLGSSLVADERGNVRADVLGRICDELSELHHDGRAVVVVTSGAIARG